jgi:ketosteroid isomerase-like protein
MRAAVQIFIKAGRCVLFIRISGPQSSYLRRRGSRRSNEKVLPHASVRHSSRTYRIRPKGSTTNLQPDLIQIVRWRLAYRRVCAPARAFLQRSLRPGRPSRCLALPAARTPYSTSSNAALISYALLILSILSVIFFIIPQSTAQEISPKQAPPLTQKETFQQIEDRWSEAINKRDQYALELVLSPELIDISATGTVTTRDQQIAALLQGHTEPLLLDQRVVNVRSFGEIAIVVGNYVEQPRAGGRVVRQSGMFTHVYRKFLGRWSCIDAQRTAIGDSSPQKSRRSGK